MRRLGALGRLLERDLEVVAQVGAALRAARGAPPPPNMSPKPKMSPRPPRMSSKPVKTLGSKPPVAAPPRPGVAEAVVHVALVGVGEHRVRLGRFLELVLRLLVAGIAVGMVLERQLAVRALDFLRRSRSWRRRGPRSSRACSRLGDLHHRRRGAGDRPACSRAAAPPSPRLRGASSLGSWLTAWWMRGSKSVPTASIGVTPRLRSRSSICWWISSTPARYRADVGGRPAPAARARGCRRSAAISVSRLGARPLGLLAALALDALAVVVELGGRAQQAILQRVALAS